MFAVVGFFTWSALTDPRRGGTAVAASDDVFTPFVIEIDTGAEVTFDFVGAIAHDVSFDDGAASPEMVSDSYTRTVDEPGVYDFVCTIHSLSMRGRGIATDS